MIKLWDLKMLDGIFWAMIILLSGYPLNFGY